MKKQRQIKETKKNERGITLIALVVTIIVLLILAGIAINLIVGNNGLFTRAESAEKESEIAEVIDMARMDIMSKEVEKQGVITKQDLEKILEQYGTLPEGEENILDKTLTTKEGNDIEVRRIYDGEFAEEKKKISFKIDDLSFSRSRGGYMGNMDITR